MFEFFSAMGERNRERDWKVLFVFVRLGLATALVWAFSGLCFATDLYPLFLCLADNVHGRRGVTWHVAGRGENSARRRLGGSCTEGVGHWHYYGYTIDMLDASQEIFHPHAVRKKMPLDHVETVQLGMAAPSNVECTTETSQVKPRAPARLGTLLLNPA